MPTPEIVLTPEDLGAVLDVMYEFFVSEEMRAEHDRNDVRRIKQAILDQVWPGCITLIQIANVRLNAAAAAIWEEGRVSGDSHAMHRVTDEHGVADAKNPYEVV